MSKRSGGATGGLISHSFNYIISGPAIPFVAGLVGQASSIRAGERLIIHERPDALTQVNPFQVVSMISQGRSREMNEVANGID